MVKGLTLPIWVLIEYMNFTISRRIVQFEVKIGGSKIATMMIVTNIPFRLFT